jgi:hypothetical protein
MLFELDRQVPWLIVRLGYKLDDGRILVRFLAEGREYPLLYNVPTQPPTQRFSSVISSKLKRQGREVDHSPPSNDEIKNGGAISSFPHTSSWCGV